MSAPARGVRRLPRRAGSLAAALAVTTVLSGCGFHGLYSTPLPGGASLGSHPYTVTVDFADVLDLVPQSGVRVNDVPVGRVESVALDGWTAKVTVKVNGDVHLPANAHAELLQTSLLGEKYVSLEAPTDQAAQGTLTDGATIPLSRTTRNPEVEEVLGALSLLLNGGGLAQIRTINYELNQALHGNEGQTRDLLAQLKSFVGTLDTQKDSITTAITNVDRLAATLNAQKQIILTTLDTLPGALKVLAGERDQFVTLLQSLSKLGSTATTVINASEKDLATALKELDPVLSTLTAAGDDLPNGLQLLLTYPFPENVGGAVRGDYTNLSAAIDLNLSDLLGNLASPTAGTGAPLSSTSTQSAQDTAVQQAAAAKYLPIIPGLDGGS